MTDNRNQFCLSLVEERPGKSCKTLKSRAERPQRVQVFLFSESFSPLTSPKRGQPDWRYLQVVKELGAVITEGKQGIAAKGAGVTSTEAGKAACPGSLSTENTNSLGLRSCLSKGSHVLCLGLCPHPLSYVCDGRGFIPSEILYLTENCPTQCRLLALPWSLSVTSEAGWLGPPHCLFLHLK